MNDPLATVPTRVRVCEVGPRDGLQNVSTNVATADKVRYVELLLEAGVRELEVSSFVSPRAVPQLADAEAVFAALGRRDDVRAFALVPNERGLDRALAAGVRDVVVFTAASETFARRNIGMTIDESLATFARLAARARAAGLRVRGALSTAFGCPFEGAVAPARIAALARRLLDLGCEDLSVADTIGVGTPRGVVAIVGALDAAGIGTDRFGLHFHDTRGAALANVVTALELGVQAFDASAGGLGGCPFAPGATGNLATEDLLAMLDGMGIASGIDLSKLRAATRFMATVLPGHVASRAFAALEAADARTAVSA